MYDCLMLASYAFLVAVIALLPPSPPPPPPYLRNGCHLYLPLTYLGGETEVIGL